MSDWNDIIERAQKDRPIVPPISNKPIGSLHTSKYHPNYRKVSELPFVFGVLTRAKLDEIRRTGGQPKCMHYRIEFIKGRGASTKDETWDRAKHLHTCCQSKVPWRHKAKCQLVLKQE